MGELKELIKTLLGPLEVEAKRGYRDNAIIGQSLGEYAQGWAERAKAQSSDNRAAITKIVKALADYRDCRIEERKQRVTVARGVLEGLGGGRGGAQTVKRQETRKSREACPPSTEHSRLTTERHGGGCGHARPTLDLQLSLSERFSRAGWPKKLAGLGIETVRDLLYHFPRDYTPVCRINELADGDKAAVVAEVVSRQVTALRERRSFRLMRFLLTIKDETGEAFVVSHAKVPRFGQRGAIIMNSPVALNYEQGTRLFVEGAIKRAGKFIEIQFAGAQKLMEEEGFAPGSLAPVYPLTEGVYQEQIRQAVKRLLEELPPELPDPLPDSLRKRHKLLRLREALERIHWPKAPEQVEAARKRLAFEELLTVQVALAQRKRERQQPGCGISMKPRGDTVVTLEEILPYSLTRAQQRAIAEITADMAADIPMSRLLQGDVGSGKTVVAVAALIIALQNGYQGALMAPTELLAEQHYLVLSRMLEPLGVRMALLTGSLRGNERERIYAELAGGRTQLVVGTHALIQEGVEFEKLGLVVVDEQHRFGVRQRSELRTKGRQPDMLVMTATPIPRTLALTIYGDLDISVLDEMPPGRTPVKTMWKAFQQQDEVYEFVRKQVAEGRQAYLVCPLVEESEKLQAEAATKLAEQLQREVFTDFSVGLLHGAMPVAEKEAMMESFRTGEKELLCATTVIEVGVDVPNANVMLILNAERFGLAQLHQLRGRVGRGAHESYCILMTDRKYHPLGRIVPAGEDLSQARDRLKVMLETTDGFAIAEQDLLLRGPGEFYGTRQHGLPDFRLARLAGDMGVLEEARAAAMWLIEHDADLKRPEHVVLRSQVGELRARMNRTEG